jgi:hypothetical protein
MPKTTQASHPVGEVAQNIPNEFTPQKKAQALVERAMRILTHPGPSERAITTAIDLLNQSQELLKKADFSKFHRLGREIRRLLTLGRKLQASASRKRILGEARERRSRLASSPKKSNISSPANASVSDAKLHISIRDEGELNQQSKQEPLREVIQPISSSTDVPFPNPPDGTLTDLKAPSKLSPEQLGRNAEFRKLMQDFGETNQTRLAKLLDCSQSHISGILVERVAASNRILEDLRDLVSPPKPDLKISKCLAAEEDPEVKAVFSKIIQALHSTEGPLRLKKAQKVLEYTKLLTK